MGLDQPARSEVKSTHEVRTFRTRDEMRSDVLELLTKFRDRAQAPTSN